MCRNITLVGVRIKINTLRQTTIELIGQLTNYGVWRHLMFYLGHTALGPGKKIVTNAFHH